MAADDEITDAAFVQTVLAASNDCIKVEPRRRPDLHERGRALTPGPDETAFVLSWTESGGPPVVPPMRTGLGSGMIQRALSGYVGGATT